MKVSIVTSSGLASLVQAAKMAAAESMSATFDQYMALARDEDPEVRRALARNPNCPAAVQAVLADPDNGEEPNFDVVMALTENPSPDPDILWQLAESPYWVVRCAVLRHPRCSAEIAAKLVDDIAGEVRTCVAQADRIAPNVLAKLLHDPDPCVREAAWRNPIAQVNLKDIDPTIP